MNSNWVHESTSKSIRQKAEKVLTDLKKKKYKDRKIKSIRYEEIPGSYPKVFREIIEYDE